MKRRGVTFWVLIGITALLCAVMWGFAGWLAFTAETWTQRRGDAIGYLFFCGVFTAFAAVLVDQFGRKS